MSFILYSITGHKG